MSKWFQELVSNALFGVQVVKQITVVCVSVILISVFSLNLDPDHDLFKQTSQKTIHS